MCFACYQRQLRGTALPQDARCWHCGDRRRPVLKWSAAGQGERVVLCHNCAAMARRLKPKPKGTADLLVRLEREVWDDDRRQRLLSPRKHDPVDIEALAAELLAG